MFFSTHITLFILSSAYILSNISPSLQHIKNRSIHELTNPIVSEQDGIVYGSNLREEQNNNLMLKFEDEWKDFVTTLEHEKNKWIQEKDVEWNEWLEIMQDKWTHYDRNLSPTYKNKILEKSSKWDEFDWEYWANTEWHDLMERDWKNWIYGNKLSLNKLIQNKWINWCNDKFLEWLMNELNDDQDAYTESTQSDEDLSNSEQNENPELNMEDEIFSKNKEWESWTDKKEKLIKKIKNDNWKEWKNNKYATFNTWRESFIKKWIKEKQWEILTQNK
ncbi:tryptophan-rich antigen [Plasmodium gonderi]|uniref:Tryptophan-rich antigen n=1 Tax=Plasmodium gonderi TaxID=77519 RepID=A0A1Y1JF90_PLAGO|nr:tryptophan-rich antigen [Plasmodium gonderi]GAW79412.1 tryptophan-rich antigen [Plasmodium gonderi]